MAKKRFIPKLKNRYRFIIYNDSTFAEIFSLRLSLLNTYVVLVGGALLFIIIGIFIACFTPIQQFFRPDEQIAKSKLYQNTLRIDSLENILLVQDLQYKRMQLILAGKDSLLQNPKDTLLLQNANSSKKQKQINYIRAKADSILRAEFEAQNRFNVTQGKAIKEGQVFNLYLYPPVKNGIINNSPKEENNNAGVYIRAKAHSHIMATSEGTVINTDWSIEDGYTIIIQHDNNLISVYKHTAELLKKVGDKVQRGEAIAILGSTGNTSTPPHLLFELWHKGIPLNPKDFISF